MPSPGLTTVWACLLLAVSLASAEELRLGRINTDEVDLWSRKKLEFILASTPEVEAWQALYKPLGLLGPGKSQPAGQSAIESEFKMKVGTFSMENDTLADAPTELPFYPICKTWKYDRYVRVATTMELQDAINSAEPGDLIEMMQGTYDRPAGFNLTFFKKDGTEEQPITLCGPRKAVITGEGNLEKKPYILHVKQSSYIRLLGFTLFNGFKGLVLDSSNNVVARRLQISDTDYEAVRIRYNSTDNTIRECTIKDIGKSNPGMGEGIYVGSSRDEPYDYSNNNRIVGNTIGPGVTAELIDIKEYTQGGLVAYNTLDGSDLSNENYADSWVDVKGSSWVVHDNVGFKGLKDGFQTHDMDVSLSGESNFFARNVCNLGEALGVCVFIQCDGPEYLCSNIVSCDNEVDNGKALTNLAECSDPLPFPLSWKPAADEAEAPSAQDP